MLQHERESIKQKKIGTKNLKTDSKKIENKINERKKMKKKIELAS